MTVTLVPGDRGIDISGKRLSSATDIASMKAAGGKFVLRYSAGMASSPSNSNHSGVAWKLITPAEFHALISAGFDVIANDEWYESRCTEGAAAGAADGHAAGALWASCGLYKGASIYVSWDAAPVASKWGSVDAYGHAYQTSLNAYGYHLDGYAGTPYLRHAIGNRLFRYGWRPNAGSWSGDGLPYQPTMTTLAERQALLKLALTKTPAHIWQTGNYWFSKQADENMILRTPVGSHWDAYRAAHVVPTPAPKPTPAPVPLLKYGTDGHGATSLASPDGQWALYLGNDGMLNFHQIDQATKHGINRRTI